MTETKETILPRSLASPLVCSKVKAGLGLLVKVTQMSPMSVEFKALLMIGFLRRQSRELAW